MAEPWAENRRIVELLLNLCWLALALPAFVLWRRRALSDRSAGRSLIFICALGCVLILLFPIISASDDLHSNGLALEESKRDLRHCGHCARELHANVSCAQSALPATATAPVVLARAGAVRAFSTATFEPIALSVSHGRAPPA